MKRILCVLLCALFAASMTACSTSNSDANASTPDNATQTNISSTAKATELTDGKYDLSFTERDCNPSYDESKSAKITFSESSVEIDSGSGAKADKTTVTISSEGTYILSGKCSDGQIVVKAGDKDKIQLVLSGLELGSKTSPLVIESADKVFVTLADSSKNSLSDSESYELSADDSTVDSAIFSKADLTINGSGTLEVNGNYKHAIVSKDDLVITGGELNVNSVSSAIDGKDCVKMQNTIINIKSGGDGIRSTNIDETDTRGFVYIAGGNYNIESTNDSFQSASMLRIDDGNINVTAGGGSANAPEHTESFGGGRFGMNMFSNDSDSEDTESAKAIKSADSIKINGGTITINSSDDAVHSNNTAVVTGGTLTINTGDDGLHADNKLTIDGGTIDIKESYEGIEAGEIVVNDGTISLVSSDDGFNAAGGANNTNNFDSFSDDSGKTLTINGGYIYVNATGDGLDSNGTITINGGITLVNGPSDNNNAAVDFEQSGKVTGGVLVALGSSGMAEAISGEGQGAITTAFDTQSEDTVLAICDSNNKVIASLKSERSFNCAFISSPEIKSDSNYKIICGGTVENADSNGYASESEISGGTTVAEIEMTSDTYSSGTFGGMGGKGGMKQGGGFGNRKGFNSDDDMGNMPQTPPDGDMVNMPPMPPN